ncbi:hypothetical protein AB0O34_36690, partial [Sphaerisporangium sp. NPDC088356]|uniref:hypothetical protein n=1 Tax=Sphaerisporangium sp. NPDC088356 TaxID=3154871 RepID=UPI003440B672
WKARGILTWLASHKIGFRVSEKTIIAAGPEGKSAVRAAVAELETLGYLVRTQQRVVNGTFGTVDYILTDPWTSTSQPTKGIVRSSTESRKSAHGEQESSSQVSTDDRKSAHGSESASPQVATDDRFSDGGKPAHIRRPEPQKTKEPKKTKDPLLAVGEPEVRSARGPRRRLRRTRKTFLGSLVTCSDTTARLLPGCVRGC